MKYREKTVIWEAEQFRFGQGATPEGVRVKSVKPINIDFETGAWNEEPEMMVQAVLKTERGELELEDGDWILTGPDGTHSLATAPYFAANFEPVPEELTHAAATD